MRTAPLALEDFVNPNAGRYGSHSDHDAAPEIDIEAIENDAHARGFDEGKQEGLREAEEAAFATIVRQLNEMNQELDDRLKDQEHARLSLLEELLSKLLPVLTKNGFATEAATMIEHLITDVVKSESADAIIKVAVPEADYEDVLERIGVNAEAGVVTIFPTPSLETGRMEVSWGDGGVTLDIDGIADKVLTLLRAAIDKEDSGGNTDG
ncbi:MAG: hypothetical protein AAF668_00135 [Pseudomonadota bacterium]